MRASVILMTKRDVKLLRCRRWIYGSGAAPPEKGASMLLERELIQSTGFRNVRDGGEVTGFQLRLRMPSYRGMAASLIDGVSVRVGRPCRRRRGRASLDVRRNHLHAAGAVGFRRCALAARGGSGRHGPPSRRAARGHARSVHRTASADVVHPRRAPAVDVPRLAPHHPDLGRGRRRRSSTVSRSTAS